MTRHARAAALALAAALAAAPAAAQQDTVPAPATEALVLGGGGSRGFAHAGALRALEERGHDPDLVVGNSIGALVGALYASGQTPAQIQTLIRETDWSGTFTPAPLVLGPDRVARHPLVAYDRDVDTLRFNRGIIPQWRINRALVRLLFGAEARSRGDFDRLARRYRAVAADLRTGELVVLSRGDLPRAVRASMAVPGVFAPVAWEGRSLVDGGITSNLPVSVARAEGADFVIAVEVGQPDSVIQGRSPLEVVGRAIDLMQENAQAGQPPPDVRVEPEIDPGFWGVSFAVDPGPLFRSGYEAALRDVPPAERRRAGPRPLPPPPRALAALRVEAPDSATARLARRILRRAAPRPFDEARVLGAVDALYTSGLFEGVWPRVEDEGGADPVLVVRLEAQPSLSLAGAAGYGTDRGGRAWAAVQRTGTLFDGPAVYTGTLSADGVERWAAASLRLHSVRFLPLVWTAGAHVRHEEARWATGRRNGPEVLRAGAWAGADVPRLLSEQVTSAVVRAEWIRIDGAAGGFAAGPLVRLAWPRATPPVAGVPGLVEMEARWGDVAYRRAAVHGSVERKMGPLTVAAVAEAAAVSAGTPPDDVPALGDRHAVPGLRWGQGRGRRLVVAGVDAAHPLPVLGGHARLRLRAGAAGESTGELDARDAWIGGAELGGLWSTPLGALVLAAGANTRGDATVRLEVGAYF